MSMSGQGGTSNGQYIYGSCVSQSRMLGCGNDVTLQGPTAGRDSRTPKNPLHTFHSEGGKQRACSLQRGRLGMVSCSDAFQIY